MPERRCIFVFSCPDPPPNMPLVIDPRAFTCARTDPTSSPADPPRPRKNHSRSTWITPVRGFHLAGAGRANSRLRAHQDDGAWAGHYEVNAFDHNALIGWAPDAEGLMLATVFRAMEWQHSPLRPGVAELILEGGFTTLDLSTFSPRRLTRNQPIVELNIT